MGNVAVAVCGKYNLLTLRSFLFFIDKGKFSLKRRWSLLFVKTAYVLVICPPRTTSLMESHSAVAVTSGSSLGQHQPLCL